MSAHQALPRAEGEATLGLKLRSGQTVVDYAGGRENLSVAVRRRIHPQQSGRCDARSSSVAATGNHFV